MSEWVFVMWSACGGVEKRLETHLTSYKDITNRLSFSYFTSLDLIINRMAGSNHHLPMTQDEIHPAPEMSTANDSKFGQNEKTASPTTNMVQDDVEVAPTSEKNNNKYAVDAFSAQREHAGEDYLDFRTMGWFQAGLVSTAEVSYSVRTRFIAIADQQNIALGLLSFPSVYLRLGIAGGMIATVILGTLAYITAWIMVDFKVKYMGVMNIGDAGELMFGKWGRRWFGWGLVLKVSYNHILMIVVADRLGNGSCRISCAGRRRSSSIPLVQLYLRCMVGLDRCCLQYLGEYTTFHSAGS